MRMCQEAINLIFSINSCIMFSLICTRVARKNRFRRNTQRMILLIFNRAEFISIILFKSFVNEENSSRTISIDKRWLKEFLTFFFCFIFISLYLMPQSNWIRNARKKVQKKKVRKIYAKWPVFLVVVGYI